MKNANILYLASSSPYRYRILKDSNINCEIIKQTSQEHRDNSLPFYKLVESIALSKMESIILPNNLLGESEDSNFLKQGDQIFVLTADTMTQDKFGQIHGKPENYQDCIEKIKQVAGISQTCTAFCLDKKVFDGQIWVTTTRVLKSVISTCDFIIESDWFDSYIKNTEALECCGGLDITGYGEQFLKSVTGSYSAILGLPIFEVRIELEKLGFFDL